MAESKVKNFMKNMFRIGTPECAISFALVAMVLAVMFLVVGFWQTLLIMGLMLVGAFLGGVKDKKQWFLNLLNKIFPPKNTIPYRERNAAIEKAVRETMEADAAEKKAE